MIRLAVLLRRHALQYLFACSCRPTIASIATPCSPCHMLWCSLTTGMMVALKQRLHEALGMIAALHNNVCACYLLCRCSHMVTTRSPSPGEPSRHGLSRAPLHLVQAIWLAGAERASSVVRQRATEIAAPVRSAQPGVDLAACCEVCPLPQVQGQAYVHMLYIYTAGSQCS